MEQEQMTKRTTGLVGMYGIHWERPGFGKKKIIESQFEIIRQLNTHEWVVQKFDDQGSATTIGRYNDSVLFSDDCQLFLNKDEWVRAYQASAMIC
jgi:hypothetical protein